VPTYIDGQPSRGCLLPGIVVSSVSQFLLIPAHLIGREQNICQSVESTEPKYFRELHE
jgi:hypothetical protein